MALDLPRYLLISVMERETPLHLKQEDENLHLLRVVLLQGVYTVRRCVVKVLLPAEVLNYSRPEHLNLQITTNRS
jgi:hypothetical protein